MFSKTHLVMDAKETLTDLLEEERRHFSFKEFKHFLSVLRLQDQSRVRNASKSKVQLSRIGEFYCNDLDTPLYFISRIPFSCKDYVSISDIIYSSFISIPPPLYLYIYGLLLGLRYCNLLRCPKNIYV